MRKGAFSFADVDMYEAYGILVEEVEDILMPVLRPRKVEIPDRSGAYDFGAKYRDERVVTLTCGTIRTIARNDIREFAYAISKKGPLRLWYEADKYYYGRIYDPANIERQMEKLQRFQLPFVCDPYAYGKVVTKTFTNLSDIDYGGTAPAPLHITIYNPNGYTMNGITITKREEQEL